MNVEKLAFLCFVTLFFSCNDVTKAVPGAKTIALIEKSKALKVRGDKIEQRLIKKRDSIEGRSYDATDSQNSMIDVDFVNIQDLSDEFVLDMRYATSNNFLKEKVYSCAKCYVKEEVAKALIKANADLMKQGYRIKFFDCYRPHSVQKKMWKIFPNPGYVADPKGGSIHNKGAAVDITLVRSAGGGVDMGTEFDHFGKKAHHAYTKLSKTVLEHRKLLRSTMEKYGFKTIRTEWWHYNYQAGIKYKISDFKWECD